MPYARLSIEVTVPNDQLARAREAMETAIDSLLLENVHTYDVEVWDTCVDPPTSTEEDDMMS